MIWLILIGVIALLLLYFYILRPVLKDAPLFSDVFKAEASFLDKLKVYTNGWKTKIVSRLFTVAGILVGLYDQVLPLLAGHDWTPITSHLPGWALPVASVAVGVIFEWLRKLTDNPPQMVVSLNESDDMVVDKVLK